MQEFDFVICKKLNRIGLIASLFRSEMVEEDSFGVTLNTTVTASDYGSCIGVTLESSILSSDLSFGVTLSQSLLGINEQNRDCSSPVLNEHSHPTTSTPVKEPQGSHNFYCASNHFFLYVSYLMSQEALLGYTTFHGSCRRGV